MKYNFIALILLCPLWTFAQQQAKVYTLPYCLQIGLENNLSLKISKNNQEMSANNATRSNAGMTPTIDLSGSYEGTLQSGETNTRAGSTTTTTNSLNRVLDASADLEWTIFDGYSMQATYERLKQLRRQGEIQTRITTEDLIAGITTEYYNYVQQKIRLKNFRYAVKLSQERLRIAQERFNVGKGSGLEYQQATVDFNADSSQYVKQHELVETSRINLNRQLGIKDVSTKFVVRDTLIKVNENLVFNELNQSMIERNSEILLAASNNSLAEADFKKVCARDYPYLTLQGGYGYTNRMYSKGTNKSSGEWGPQVGLTVGFHLFDGNRRRERKNAQLQIDNMKYEKEDLELQLQADIHNFWQAYENNIKVLHLERENVRVAQNNYEIARYRYLLGDLSGIEMREAQKSLLDANERILSAEYTTKACEISLLQICGRIQEYMQ